MTAPYDFGSDAYGQYLAKHLRIEERFPGIHVLDPYNDQSTSDPEAARTAVAQAKAICDGATRGAANGLWRTVIVDTITNLTVPMINQFARSKVNRDDSSKHYTLDLGDGFLHNVPGINWRDNGMAQREAYQIRDRLLTAPEPFHLWILGHEVLKEDIGLIGMDAGGPSSAAKFHGGMFSVYLNIFRTSTGAHALATREYTRGINKVQVSVKAPPGVTIPADTEEGFIKLEPDFAQNVAVHKLLMDTLGLRYMRAGLHGMTNAGKTAFTSAFLGLPDTLPCLVVMSDNQRDLPTWYPEAKAAASTNTATTNDQE